MGAEIETYCGPYCECQVQKTTIARQERQCSNAACASDRSQNQDKYCSKCGSAIKNVEVQSEVDAVDPFELQEELDEEMEDALYAVQWGVLGERLSGQGMHIWVDIRHLDKWGQRLLVNEHGLSELRPGDMEKEVSAFQKVYKKQLAKLKSHYGPDNVAVKWGIVELVFE